MFLRAKRGQITKVLVIVTLMVIVFFLIAMFFRKFLGAIFQ
jgi:uncharacterized protein (UPF0333 family)